MSLLRLTKLVQIWLQIFAQFQICHQSSFLADILQPNSALLNANVKLRTIGSLQKDTFECGRVITVENQNRHSLKQNIKGGLQLLSVKPAAEV